jgi:hypothetical protein
MMIAIVLSVGLSLPHVCSAANYTYSYWLLDSPEGSTRYKLTVSVTPSLYEYYRSKDHTVYSLDFAKFVTPYALKPIADSLWSIHSDEEDFANGVLMIVHQIPYVESAPQKYPVETIVQNEGDCDLFSFVAASIMMAGGLDVVLFYYEAEKHMNVGVYLPFTPNDARSTVYYIDYNGKPYYIAETTGGSWEKGWRVGECPDELKRASAQIIPLENAEQMSPGQVSSSYSALASSTISLTLSSTYIVRGGTVTISGQLTPAGSNKAVTIYVRKSGSQWSVLGTTITDSDGKFLFLWVPKSASTYYIRASWSGNSDYAGADSDIHTLMVISVDWMFILITSVVSASMILVVVIIAILKRGRTPIEETFPDEETVETST